MSNWRHLYKSIKETYGDEPEHKLIEYIDLIEKGKVSDLGYDVEAIDISEKNIEEYIS